ncbi:anthranilate phosphoribosyltransferase [Flavobacteriaceae bacterium]|jgi:anthranilate phosphoribosyltransferase|nr:anthranilate phosphoribosyltransferase [bacterium]MDA9595574.1 anthranilate phosphoribosyltransferase [Flavobacteriaceae bacterium]MDC6466260.1 anthranilate phosphoribosyltransferase [Flavobacteriaceae bacterium]|tara:strand:+ start:363 stop:1355 length:993 start_codon:yes stop_codon:yes gene_type:complete
MKKILNRLTQYETLTENESRNIIIDISEGKLNTSQISSFLTIFMVRNITIEELNGFRKALIELSLKIDLKEFDPIDLCGTGGDEKDTFNISTLASFVTAGSGVKVAKHGNYGVSSSCGSSNVLEYLDLKFNNDSDKIRKAVDKANICFLHAPLFHPAMKNVAPVRKELGLKTFFNMLGPMVNPSMPEKQVVGVYNLELARIYNYLYQTTDINYNIIHSIDGYDEISLTNGTKVYSRESEFILGSEDFNLKDIDSKNIIGGKDIKSSSKIFIDVLNGKGSTDQENVVCANASLAIAISKDISIIEAFNQAKESIKTKNALKCFNDLINIMK